MSGEIFFQLAFRFFGFGKFLFVDVGTECLVLGIHIGGDAFAENLETTNKEAAGTSDWSEPYSQIVL